MYVFLGVGYERSEIIGRNCRFLQGPDTDPSHVATIREGIASGKDTAVVLTNYKKDGTPFSEWLPASSSALWPDRMRLLSLCCS